MKHFLAFAYFFLISFAAAALGTLATNPEIDGWYRSLVRPQWTPPDAVFGPVWTALYLLMAISAWLVWRAAGLQRAVLPLVWFHVQLTLNVLWSWIFFHFHQPGWAFLEILCLWGAIAVTIFHFLRIRRLAGMLMMPYLAWVSFAAGLNLTIWQLNPGGL